MKKLVRPLLAGAGVAGGLAAANRALANGPLVTNALGGTRRPWAWRGHDIFATEAGEGSPVLLVHGVAAGCSSYEFRALFERLAQRHRVVAFDLLGCGLSAKPALPYATELFVAQIGAAFELLGDEPLALIGSGLGAAFAVRAAVRAPGRVTRVAAICPGGLHAPAADRARNGAALAGVFRTPLVGEALWNGFAAKRAIRWFLEHRVYGDPRHVTDEIVDHFYAVMHQPGARYVPAALTAGALRCDAASDVPFLHVPLLVLWGEKAAAPHPVSDAAEFARLANDAQIVTFAHSGLLPHEEEPDAVADALLPFLSAG